MNLAAELLSVGEPDAVAIYAGPTEVTYRALRDKVESAARLLLSRGGTRQDRVAILAENGVFFVVSYLAVIRAGMVAVPLQTDESPETTIRILQETNARTLLVSPRHATQVNGWAPLAHVSILGGPDLAASDGSRTEPLPDMDPTRDLASLMFTSGSTGQPKGVMVTHGNIACNTRDIVSYLGLSPTDRTLAVLPFYYCFGLSVLHSQLAAGATLIINNQFMYPEKVLQEINDRACTGLAGVPSTFQILLRKSRFLRSTFPSLRWLQQAGGRLPNPCILEIVEAFPHVRFYVMYGQTEATARLSYLPPERLHDKLGSIGRGLPSTRLDVLRPDGTRVAPGGGEVGEIVASGRNVTLGYWNDPQETAKYFRDGKLYTGDLAHIDADGFIYIVERARDIIKSGGNRVSASEIEDVIAEVRDVLEVAVVGAADEILGEAIVAFVAVSDTAVAPSPEVLAHCRQRLPAWKTPHAVVHVRQLPHSGSGKVMKANLKSFAADVVRSASRDFGGLLSSNDSVGAHRIER